MKTVRLLLALALLSYPLSAEQSGYHGPLGEAAGYSSRDATVLSMMGWGVGLAVGIGLLCALIDNNGGAGHSH
jgi:hypothetical protein